MDTDYQNQAERKKKLFEKLDSSVKIAKALTVLTLETGSYSKLSLEDINALMKDNNEYITHINKLNSMYNSNDIVFQVPSTDSNIYNCGEGFEIHNYGEPENNDYDISDYDQPYEQYERDASELELSNSGNSVNQPITSFKQAVSIQIPRKKPIKEQQSNPLTYDPTSISSSDEEYTTTTIANIPYSKIQEFKTLADFIAKDFRPSVELDTKYTDSGIKTLLKVKIDPDGNIIPSADTFYNTAPLSTLDKPVIVNGKQYDLGKVAEEFFTSVAVKVDVNSEDKHDLAAKYRLHETKEQAAYLLIRRFYNMTGFLLEFRNKKGVRRCTFELVFKSTTDSSTNPNKQCNIVFTLDPNLGCYTITEGSRRVFTNLFFYSRSPDDLQTLILKDSSIEKNVQMMKHRLVTTPWHSVGEVIESELGNVLPASLIKLISHKKIFRNAKNQNFYAKNKDTSFELSNVEVYDSENQNMDDMYTTDD